jgi:short-subunit dehydrogenase
MANGRVAVLTGASSGIGEATARELTRRGWHCVLLARRQDLLERIAGEIGAEWEVCDVSDRAQVDEVAARILERHPAIGLLVNNAGFGLGQPFVGGDLAANERGLEVMVRAVMVLSHAAANAMVERGRGAILNVSSIAALTVTGTYSADKAWVRVFTEALAVELRGTGVTATALCPGLVHTEFHERAGLSRPVPELAWLNADAVVSAALADVRRGAVISTPSLRYGVLSEVVRMLPRSAVRALSGDRRMSMVDATPPADGSAPADGEQ